MDENVSRILQLLQDGKISAKEAESLITALNAKAAPAPPQEEPKQEPAPARAQKLPTGDLLLNIADDPSIPENEKLAIIIHATALLCTIIALQPIPGVDVLVLTPIQVASVMAMSHVMGTPLGKNGAGEVVASVVAVVGWGVIAEQFVLAGAKIFLPLFGGIALIPLVYAASYGLSYAARAVLEARRGNQKLSDAEIRRIKEEAERRAKAEKRDWSLAAIKRELDEWRSRAEAFQQYEARFDELQQRSARLQQEIEPLSAQAMTAAQEKMSLERQLQTLSDRLQAGVSEEERNAVTTERDTLQKRLNEVNAFWVTTGSGLETKRKELERDQQNLIALLEERFGKTYPNVRFEPQVLTGLTALPLNRLRLAERQVALFQHDPAKANFTDAPFTDYAGRSIQIVGFDDEGRLYALPESGGVMVLWIGNRETQNKDMEHLRSGTASL